MIVQSESGKWWVLQLDNDPPLIYGHYPSEIDACLVDSELKAKLAVQKPVYTADPKKWWETDR